MSECQNGIPWRSSPRLLVVHARIPLERSQLPQAKRVLGLVDTWSYSYRHFYDTLGPRMETQPDCTPRDFTYLRDTTCCVFDID